MPNYFEGAPEPLVLGAEVALGVAAPVPPAGFSFREKYQTPARATMHAPKIILRTSWVISHSCG